MNTKDKKPDEKETVRTGNEESRPKGEDAPYEDSVELFSSLFRAETEAITKQGGEASQGPKADSKPGKAGVSPPSQGSGPPRAKAPALVARSR